MAAIWSCGSPNGSQCRRGDSHGAQAGERRRAMTTNITADHRAAFEALVSGDYCNLALFSCFVNGEPGASDCRCKPGLWRLYHQALFVSVTPSMTLTDHAGRPDNDAPP
jgi:hypothetical protein